jgi:hypothetical protein
MPSARDAHDPDTLGTIVGYGRTPLGVMLVALLAAMPECKRHGVVAHQDSPRATVRSLLDVYDAKEWGKLEALVDPSLTRAEARMGVCRDEYVKGLAHDLLQEVTLGDDFRIGPRPGRSFPTGCVCGEKGRDAAARAPAFVSGAEDLKLRGFLVSSCEVIGDRPLSSDGLEDLDADVFDRTCGEVDRSSSLAAVAVRCDGKERTVVLIRRGSDWKVVALPPPQVRTPGDP